MGTGVRERGWGQGGDLRGWVVGCSPRLEACLEEAEGKRLGRSYAGGATPPPFSSLIPAGGVSAQRPGGQVLPWRPGVGRRPRGAVIQAGPGEDPGMGQGWGGGVSALSDWLSGRTPSIAPP